MHVLLDFVMHASGDLGFSTAQAVQQQQQPLKRRREAVEHDQMTGRGDDESASLRGGDSVLAPLANGEGMEVDESAEGPTLGEKLAAMGLVPTDVRSLFPLQGWNQIGSVSFCTD